MEPRLKTEFWIKAQVITCDRAAVSCMVVRRGDPDAGGVLLKVNRLGRGCAVLARVLDGDGKRVWMAAAGGAAEKATQATELEKTCDAYIQRQLNIDPDLWVVEIEDPDGRYTPDGGGMAGP